MRGAARVGHRHGARGRLVRVPSHPDPTAVELGAFAFCLSVDTVRALAEVLEVTPPAVTKAESVRRITRDEAGRFDVFGVLDAWCRNTRHPCGAAEATQAPWWIEWGYDWLARPAYGDDPLSREWDWWDEQRRRDAVLGFIRRTRHAGGHVYARQLTVDGDEDGYEVPDPVTVLAGTEPLDFSASAARWAGAALEELRQLVHDAEGWLRFARLAVPELAARVGVAPEVLGPHLTRVVRDWIADAGVREDKSQKWGQGVFSHAGWSEEEQAAYHAAPEHVPAPRPARRGPVGETGEARAEAGVATVEEGAAHGA